MDSHSVKVWIDNNSPFAHALNSRNNLWYQKFQFWAFNSGSLYNLAFYFAFTVESSNFTQILLRNKISFEKWMLNLHRKVILTKDWWDSAEMFIVIITDRRRIIYNLHKFAPLDGQWMTL